jgi:cysteinyl-tRNA synthetase
VETIVGILGLDDAEPAPISSGDISDEEIELLVARRDKARAAGDFHRADEIRNELGAAGVSIEDGPDGTRWLRK